MKTWCKIYISEVTKQILITKCIDNTDPSVKISIEIDNIGQVSKLKVFQNKKDQDAYFDKLTESVAIKLAEEMHTDAIEAFNGNY